MAMVFSTKEAAAGENLIRENPMSKK